MILFFKTFLLLGVVNCVGMLVGLLAPSWGLEPTFGKVVVTVLFLFVGLAGFVVTKPEQK